MRVSKRFLATVAVVGLSMYPYSQARGGTIQDGGFESATAGTYATGPIGDGWNVTEGTIGIFNNSGGIGTAHSGSQFADLDQSDTLNGLSQTIGTTAGDTYQITFWLSDDTGGNSFQASFGATTLVNETTPDLGLGNYTELTYDATAGGVSTALLFTGQYLLRGGSVGTVIDDVSVTDMSAQTPEPATFGMIGAALSFLGLRRLRRNR
ncbi:MAG: PEP-CTERM sorting domain-containing protein [Bryobacteraceae bacterium]